MNPGAPDVEEDERGAPADEAEDLEQPWVQIGQGLVTIHNWDWNIDGSS